MEILANMIGDYPPGAEYDPNAPYNQKEQEPVYIDVCVSCTLSKSTTIKGNPEVDDLKDIYEQQEYTIPELLDEFDWFLRKEIVETKATIKLLDDDMSNAKKALESSIIQYNNMLKSIKGWTVDELEVIKE